MHLQAHYDAMRETARRALAQGQASLDPLLDSPLDGRRGITLLSRVPPAIAENINGILADFQQLEPKQYYYPPSDLHLTILSIISCYEGFTLDLIEPAAYERLVGEVLRRTPPFRVTFSGLTASPGGLLIQGFPQDDGLEKLRNELRTTFRASGLQQSIDQRYSIQTAHSTVLRFRAPLLNTEALLQKLARYERQFIGSFDVTELELVYNDWYQRAATTRLLARYSLGPAASASPATAP